MDTEINEINTSSSKNLTNTIKEELEKGVDEDGNSINFDKNNKINLYNTCTSETESERYNSRVDDKNNFDDINTIYFKNTTDVKEEYEEDKLKEMPIYEITNMNIIEMQENGKVDKISQCNIIAMHNNAEIAMTSSETCKARIDRKIKDEFDASSDELNHESLIPDKHQEQEREIGTRSQCQGKIICEDGLNSLKVFILKPAYGCGICHETFTQKETLNFHVNKVHISADGRGSYNCFKCEYKTYLKLDFRGHIDREHCDIKMFECSNCDFKTNITESLQRHLLAHEKAKQLQCPRCDYKTHRTDRLKNHSYTHEAATRFKCTECEYVTNNKACLKAHQGAKHCKVKKYKCMECDFETAYEHSLKGHLSSHEKIKQLKCEQCEFQTNYKWHLNVHIKVKHCQLKNFKCDQCTFETSYSHSLKKHLFMHDPAKYIKKFKCAQCNFETNYKPSLREHVNGQHGDSKNYKCSLCLFETAYRYSLKKHMDSHGNEKQI